MARPIVPTQRIFDQMFCYTKLAFSSGIAAIS